MVRKINPRKKKISARNLTKKISRAIRIDKSSITTTFAKLRKMETDIEKQVKTPRQEEVTTFN